MTRQGTKEAAEAALRELPSVIGAFVREDVHGNPREVHLLVRAGPNPRHLAYDIRGLLEERLGVPIDQRVISIAQLATDRVPGPLLAEAAGLAAAAQAEAAGLGAAVQPAAAPAPAADSPPAATDGAEAAAAAAAPTAAPAAAPAAACPPPPAAAHASASARPPTAAAEEPAPRRVRFAGVTTESMDQRARTRVAIEFEGTVFSGEAAGLDTVVARARAAATATLQAVGSACTGAARFEVEHIALLDVFQREYVVVAVLASSPYLGRTPLSLVGAQPVELDAESAAALAALKALNRTLSLLLAGDAGAALAVQPRRGR
jgi:hypothetical protein